MSMAKRILLVLVALALSGAGDPAWAQRGLGGGGLRVNGVGPRLGENIQLALQNRDRLGLSSDQVTRLQELQSGVEADILPLRREIDALRSNIMTDGVGHTRGWPRLQDLLAELDVVAEPYRTGVANVLTPEQHTALQQMMFSSRPYGGRGYGRAGTGFRPVPGSVSNTLPGAPRGTVPPRPYGLGRGGGRALGLGAGAVPGRGLARGIGLGFGRGMGGGLAMGAGRGIARGAGRWAGRSGGRGFRRIRW